MDKVLISISSLIYGGGAEKNASLLGNELCDRGKDVSFLTFYSSKKKYKVIGNEICLNENEALNPFFKIFKLFARAKGIAEYCKENQIDSSISFMEEANFSNILSKAYGNKSKIIISVRQSLHRASMLYKFLVYILYRLSDTIVVVTEAEKRNLLTNYAIKKSKLHLIHNPIDIEYIDSKKDEKLQENNELFSSNKFSFVNVGRLTEAKNQELLIKVFDRFNEQYPDTQLIIIGDGELRDDLDAINTNKNIHMLGSQENPYKFISRSNSFILSSSWEGFPNVLLEAMACNTPIISTNCKTGPQEILENGKSGLLVKVNDFESLYAGMESIYNDEARREEYARHGLTRVKDFSKDKVIDSWMGILSR